jgi:protein-disulfide isomerase
MSSRTRTRERRKQREVERRRNRQYLVVGALVVLAVVAVILVIVSNQPAEAPIPEESVARYEGIPQSVNEAGYPVLGDPEAPVQVVEYSSFDCPHCMEFYQIVTPSLIERAEAGDISFTYVPVYGTGGVPNGQGAARAALCAGEQGQFWPYHSALFSWQSIYGNQALGGNRLEAGAENLGLDMGAWLGCIQSGSQNEVVETARNSMLTDGVTGTPTLLVNGVAVGNPTNISEVNAAIDTALAAS